MWIFPLLTRHHCRLVLRMIYREEDHRSIAMLEFGSCNCYLQQSDVFHRRRKFLLTLIGNAAMLLNERNDFGEERYHLLNGLRFRRFLLKKFREIDF